MKHEEAANATLQSKCNFIRNIKTLESLSQNPDATFEEVCFLMTALFKDSSIKREPVIFLTVHFKVSDN